MDLLLEGELPVSISFGKTELRLKDVLKLTTGSIVELNRGVNEPVAGAGQPLPEGAWRSGGGGRKLRRPASSRSSPAGSACGASNEPLDTSLALLCSPILSATAVSLSALWRAHPSARRKPEAPSRRQPRLTARFARFASRWSRSRPVFATSNDSPRHPLRPARRPPALNMTKRSQALRRHRQGDPPEEIAAALDLPHQDVDFLLKVHRIVLSSL